MNNADFGKTMDNLRKHRNIKLVLTEWRRNYLVTEPNYHTSNFFTKVLLAIVTKNSQILVNKLIYLGLSILDLNKTVMYDFWYDYVKSKYVENENTSYMDTNSFFVHVKTDDVYKDIAEGLTSQIFN